MREIKRRTLDGKVVTVLIPENAKDRAKIQRLARQKKIGTEESFADNFDSKQKDKELDF